MFFKGCKGGVKGCKFVGFVFLIVFLPTLVMTSLFSVFKIDLPKR